MKKILGLLFAVSMFSFSGSATAADFTVAVVDVPAVVSASPKFQALKKDQQAKAQEMIKFLEKARKEVASLTDADKKKAAEEKYNKELMSKKEKMDADYAVKLKELDESISNKIIETAKSGGYDIVLGKGSVYYGGTDITQDVIKAVK